MLTKNFYFRHVCWEEMTQFWATMMYAERYRRTRIRFWWSVFKKVVLMGICIWNMERCCMFVMTRVSENFESFHYWLNLRECWWNAGDMLLVVTWFSENWWLVECVLIESWHNVEEMLKGCWKNVERGFRECWENGERMLRECWESVQRMLRECWWRVVAIMSVISVCRSLVEVYWKFPSNFHLQTRSLSRSFRGQSGSFNLHT